MPRQFFAERPYLAPPKHEFWTPKIPVFWPNLSPNLYPTYTPPAVYLKHNKLFIMFPFFPIPNKPTHLSTQQYCVVQVRIPFKPKSISARYILLHYNTQTYNSPQ